MSKSYLRLRSRLSIVAVVTALATGALATDHELRIGRYQTVSIETHSDQVQKSAKPKMAAIPDELAPSADTLPAPDVGPYKDIAPKSADLPIIDQGVDAKDERSDAE